MNPRISKKFGIALACALVLGGAIVMLNVFRPFSDQGFIQKPCGDLTLGPRFMIVYVDQSARDWIDAFQDAADDWALATGVETIFWIAEKDGIEQLFHDALDGVGPEPVGGVLLVAGKTVLISSDDQDGHARLRHNPKTCRIGYAVIRVPDGPPLDTDLKYAAAAHELGHVLGLAHDSDPKSVMFHEAREGQRILRGDAARVAAVLLSDQ